MFNKIMRSKKGQVTLFVIIGVVLLLLVAAVYVGSQVSVVTNSENTADVVLDANTIIRHVESCLLKSKPVIKEIVKNGGEMVISRPLQSEGVTYNMWCLQKGSEGCKNRVFSTLKLESELNQQLKPIIDDCLNLSSFEEMGYKITEGSSTITTAIGPMNLVVYLNHPMTFRKGEFFFEHSDFNHKFDLPVGRMFEVANMILNEEIKEGYFDKDTWMKDHGAEIKIEKHKPYPNTVYHLSRISPDTKDWLQLNFAIEGKSTVSSPSESTTTNPFGWCEDENNVCFFNSEDNDCLGTKTGYKPATCVDPSDNFYPVCNGTSCLPCGSHAHGEEWCDYDGPVGNAWDMVGTRHYLKTCINGYIFTEECRDFREEMCTASGGEAICRPNRWKTCASQNTQGACEDSNSRDCVWFDYSTEFDKENYAGDERIKCFPQVPPGFKFWTLQGSEVCQMNNEWIDCDGTSCPQIWSDTSMVQCQRLGDCGYGYTIGGALGDSSFITTDLADHPDGPDPRQLLGPEYAGRTLYTLNTGPIDYVTENYDSDVFDCDDCTFEDIMERMGEYVEWISSLDIGDLALDYVLNGKVSYHTRHFTLCNPFMTLNDGDCSVCNDPYKPCTEYKCRSAGNNCYFYIDDNGYGKCDAIVGGGTGSVSILSNTASVNPSSDLNIEIFTGDIFGLEIADDVPSFSPVVVSFNTSVPAQCKKGLFPISFSDFPFDLDYFPSEPESGFNVNHSFTLYALPTDYFMDDFLTLINIQTSLQLTSIDTMDQLVNEVLGNLTSEIQGLKGTIGVDDDDVDAVIDQIEELDTYYESEVRPTMEVALDEFSEVITAFTNSIENENKMHIFFNCMDNRSNENEEQFFISYKVGPDNDAPIALSYEVENDEAINPNVNLKAIMNEPSECKADLLVGTQTDIDFEDMGYYMDCSQNYLTFEDGYECAINITKRAGACFNNVGDDFGRVAFKCRDQIFNDNVSETNVNSMPFVTQYSEDCCAHYNICH